VIETICAFSRYFVAQFFGGIVAAGFCNMKETKKNYAVFSLYTVFIFIIQLICLNAFGMDLTLKIYPLISHLPIFLFVVFYLKKSWNVGLVSFATAFLCCQPLRYAGTVLGNIFDSISMNHIGYIISAAVSYFLLRKFAFVSVWHLISKSTHSCLVFGIMPAFYYLFDYITTVYTDFMYQGSRLAVQFLPFVTATFYFVFMLLYYAETQKQIEIQHSKDILETQLKHAQNEFLNLKKQEEAAATFRHDLRHHFGYLQNLAIDGKIEDIKEYLKEAISGIEQITPLRFCENYAVNLIISSFYQKAKLHSISFYVNVTLPEKIALSDTEICSLLSNALENAINAARDIPDEKSRQIYLKIFSKKQQALHEYKKHI